VDLRRLVFSLTGVAVLARSGDGVRLIVDGEPFLCLGGELHNSSSSDASYMAPIWERLGRSGISSVVASVGWDQVEPVEGRFDFTVVDELLRGARSAGVRLVLIWFGAFKNALSTYAPTWVRADRVRFPRADRGGAPVSAPFTYEGSMPRPALSVFSAELRRADLCAYTALMQHLREVDPQHTVVVMQVENEVGLLGAGRDYSPPAIEAWNSPIPVELLEAVHGDAFGFHEDILSLFADPSDATMSWEERFGAANHVADEVFMAWGFARYLGGLADAGKKIKPLPAYANAWLGPQPGQDLPGQYPSGGPTARMGGVWRAAAPALDFIAPDIYVSDSATVMAEYASAFNPLFVPEARVRTGDAFLAVGAFNAIGYHAFGIDDVREDSQLFGAMKHLLALTPEIVAAQREGRIVGFALDDDVDAVTATLQDLTIVIRNAPKLFARMLLDVGVQLPAPSPLASETKSDSHGEQPGDSRPFGILIALGALEFIAIGQNAMIDFSCDGTELEIDTVRELRLNNGSWTDGRILNGDERLNILGSNTVTGARITLLHSGG
jgi:beta-galactosidase GanA